MAQQKQDSRQPQKGGDKKKQDNQPHGVRMSEAAKAAAVRKHRQNVERHLKVQAKRAQRAKEAATPRGTARQIKREALRTRGILFQGWRQPPKKQEAPAAVAAQS